MPFEAKMTCKCVNFPEHLLLNSCMGICSSKEKDNPFTLLGSYFLINDRQSPHLPSKYMKTQVKLHFKMKVKAIKSKHQP